MRVAVMQMMHITKCTISVSVVSTTSWRSSGPELPLLHHGALIPAENVSVLQLDVVLLAVVAPHLLDVAVVTSLLARTIVETETETTNVETATDLAVQMTGTVIWRMTVTVIARKFERTAPTAKTGKWPWILLPLHTMN
jgi:hypothetical protein